jgi:hypothetical protein
MSETTTPSAARDRHEQILEETMGPELTDEQLQQLADGATSWGANCLPGGDKLPAELKKLFK